MDKMARFGWLNKKRRAEVVFKTSGVYFMGDYLSGDWHWFCRVLFCSPPISHLRWCSQHQCSVWAEGPDHHWGYVKQQRYCKTPKYVPGAVPVAVARWLPGRRVICAVSRCCGCVCFQRTARCRSGASVECQLLSSVAWRTVLPFRCPGGAALSQQTKTEYAHSDAGNWPNLQFPHTYT